MRYPSKEVLIRLDDHQEHDDESLRDITFQLRRELLRLDVTEVRAPSVGSAPTGARGGDIASINELIAVVATSSAFLEAMVRGIQLWLDRNKGKSVKLEIDGDRLEIEGLPSDDQKQLVQQWIERHAES